ncbi:Crp/Fnr family transcriptional regulator [Dinghuibacter silviterrae]|uniref:CRP-like cAMP-binding protein n=1 Tax=Dinghuibacter silviterrae TaxID=1539049 RepID=A0A4R8DJ20_9BACT|nr:Crp/Fnr family transcriptional regulator [Dinghuibacter silviterrae]TDW97176.1 CRP-like cAMP-binding protein [Dinghuibacter silviterrae]
MEANKKAFYRFLNLFREIPTADVELISQHLQQKDIVPGQVLLQQGKTAKELFFVVSGILKIISINEKGTDVIQFFIKENRFCTILYSFNGNIVAQESIVAATTGELLVFSKTSLEALYAQLPYFKNLVERITQQALLDKIKIRNSLMGEEATIRYHKFISQQPDIMLRVPLSDVASYLGITQQSLSRIRRSFKNGKGGDTAE